MKNFIDTYLRIPQIRIPDIIEILIIALLVYEVMLWIKNTKAWMLFKGIVMVMVFVVVASFFELTTILWIAQQTLSVAVIALIIIFQPELRRALEQLGRKNLFSGFFGDGMREVSANFSDDTIEELVKAAFALGNTRTGALIVVEQNTRLSEFEKTGIPVDALVTNQLLINIFEHNTPLHDGAVIIRGDRVVAATCYLPLSDNMGVSKELGTRHRAALGMSEESDGLVIIVSEETGKVSVAYNGALYTGINPDELKNHLERIQNKVMEPKRHRLWKGRGHHEKQDS